MFVNRLFLTAFLLFSVIIYAQVKVPDTIYVYEKVIVHDTVFLPEVKAIQDLKIDKAVLEIDPITKKSSLLISSDNKTIAIPIKNTVINGAVSPPIKTDKFKIDYGVGINATAANSNFSNNTFAKAYGIGLFVRKNIFKDLFALELDANYRYIVDDKYLKEGYYTNPTIALKLIKTATSRTQFNFPLQLYWNLGKLKPSIGGFYALNSSSATFLNSSGTLPLTFDETTDYKMSFSEIGYSLGLRFDWNNNIGFSFHYTNATAGDIKFTKIGGNESVFYVSNLKFKESLFCFSIQYNFGNNNK